MPGNRLSGTLKTLRIGISYWGESDRRSQTFVPQDRVNDKAETQLL